MFRSWIDNLFVLKNQIATILGVAGHSVSVAKYNHAVIA
jgi:hypothetical protein